MDDSFDVNNDKNYFLTDGHWNNKGHEVAGQLLAQKISGIIKQQTKKRYKTYEVLGDQLVRPSQTSQ